MGFGVKHTWVLVLCTTLCNLVVGGAVCPLGVSSRMDEVTEPIWGGWVGGLKMVSTPPAN